MRRARTRALCRFAGLLLSAALVAAKGVAEPVGTRPTNVSRSRFECEKHTDGITVKMLDCAGSENDRLRPLLQRTYTATLRRIPAAQRAVLRRDKQRWLATLDDRCGTDPDVVAQGMGSLGGVLYNGCLLDERDHRITWLRGYGRTLASRPRMSGELAGAQVFYLDAK